MPKQREMGRLFSQQRPQTNMIPHENVLCSPGTETSGFQITVFSGTYRSTTRRCITRAALFQENVPGTFFKRNTSSKSNCDRNFHGQATLLVKFVDCCYVYIHTCSSLQNRKIDTISYPPIPTFISLSILDFAAL